MSLILFQHPLASFCHKVLIALYENGTPFESRVIDLGNEVSRASLLRLWPIGKFPVLRDEALDSTVPETSIIIEYLDQHYPGPVPMIPIDADAALEARLWDRFFDLYVSVPVQKIVVDRIRPEGKSDPHGVAEARATLRTAYGMIEAHMAGRDWAAGTSFGLAECAAAPALFYSSIVAPFEPEQRNLAAYFERLMARPSVARTIREAQPYFFMFPYREAMPERFLAP
jgi:glutathione S-transferase